MSSSNQFTSGFLDDGSVDVGTKFVTKSYLMDIYPDLTPIGGITAPGLFVWGYNSYGQLGTNNIVHRSTPVQTTAGGTNWKQISGGLHTTAIKTDGTLWSWGRNIYGQLGTNDTVHRSTPVQTTAGGTNWKQVSGGTNSTSAIKTDGTLWSWGYNGVGQLGTNDISDRSTLTQVSGGGTNWKQVAVAQYHTTSIKADGTLWSWGYNINGQLGTNDVTNRSTPVQTSVGGTNWKQVACGYYFTSAIKTDGTLWSWGENSNGQLGTNDIIHRSTPTQVTGGGTNWKQVSCGTFNTASIKTDGTLWTWGYNINGQLGTNDRSDRSTPTQVTSGGTNWKQVFGGYDYTTAIKTDGTLWTWGRNANGQLGTNDISDRSTPVQTTAGGTNWKQVSGGYYHIAAIQEIGDDF